MIQFILIGVSAKQCLKLSLLIIID
jgi:hypothetical protein